MPKNKQSNKKFLILAILAVIVLIGGALYFSPSDVNDDSENVSRGGKYEEFVGSHPQGEKFLEYINSAYDRLENDDSNDDMSAYIDLGFYKNELKDIEGSIKAYEAGLKLNPNNELILSNLAHIYENKKDYESARKHYQKIVNVNPKNVRAIVDFANMYRTRFDDKHQEIIDLVEAKGLSNNPDDFNLLILLANYYRYDLNDFENAEIYYRRILELDPNNKAVQVELRNLLQQQGRSLQ